MGDEEYKRLLITINSANLAANMENLNINESILNKQKRHEHDSDIIIGLLSEILKELKK